jgi:hypothetical protein
MDGVLRLLLLVDAGSAARHSASGKSSVAAGLRERFGRGLALVGQDNPRRVVLREHDRPGAANIGLIDLTARCALDVGFHVVVEGILYADRYGDMLAQLRSDHCGPTHGYYAEFRPALFLPA